MGKIENVTFKYGLFDLIEMLDLSNENKIVGCTFNGMGEEKDKT